MRHASLKDAAAPAKPTARRADLDWIRTAAFALLIVYHVGLVYGPWDWHVNSAHRVEPLRYAALALNPWRLTLLFFISGVALRFMSKDNTPALALKERALRLAPPFLFGVLVLVPPQAWIEAVEKRSWSGDFFAWWLAEFSPAGIAHGVPLNHLWFVLYIGVYSLFAVALLGAPRTLAKLEERLDRALVGWRLFLLPMLYLVVCRALLFGWFGVSNHIMNDWYNHAASFGMFLLGFLVAKRESIWRDFGDLRWALLPTAIAALIALVALQGRDGAIFFYARTTFFAIMQWSAIGAALGFAERHLRTAHSPILDYLSRAVFPCYLAHQTILVISAHLLKPAALPIQMEAALLLFATLGGSLAVYEMVRRVPSIGPLWGFKPRQTG